MECVHQLAVLLSSNASVLINAVVVRLTRLVVITGMDNYLWADKPLQYLTSHPGQLSLAIPPW